MDVQVLEGSLIEVPALDATGMERRGFGEFVGPSGELASYAFGWTSGSQPHVARLSIGIGAGNPGGGTFHAVVFRHEDGHAFSLTDDPFERVPQGGPDLTADQARAHEDLPFVWWVADHVMRHDRRAWWLRHWLLGTTCIQTLEVFEHREPILWVSHDADDGIWQLIGRSDANANTGRIGHLHHAVDRDQSLIDILDLQAGHRAERAGPKSLGPDAAIIPPEHRRRPPQGSGPAAPWHGPGQHAGRLHSPPRRHHSPCAPCRLSADRLDVATLCHSDTKTSASGHAEMSALIMPE